jgi:hypothetical protein
MARRRLAPKLKITKFEANILMYPPNIDTWICNSETCSLEGGIVNGGMRNSCWVCGHLMEDDPVFVWPIYVEACEKVGIVPGEQVWHYNAFLKRASVRAVTSGHWRTWNPETPVRLEVAQRR